jgi:hypothetical protein
MAMMAFLTIVAEKNPETRLAGPAVAAGLMWELIQSYNHAC